MQNMLNYVTELREAPHQAFKAWAGEREDPSITTATTSDDVEFMQIERDYYTRQEVDERMAAISKMLHCLRCCKDHMCNSCFEAEQNLCRILTPKE